MISEMIVEQIRVDHNGMTPKCRTGPETKVTVTPVSMLSSGCSDVWLGITDVEQS